MIRDLDSTKRIMERIAEDYLFQISSLADHNHFSPSKIADCRKRYNNSRGFQCLYGDCSSQIIIDEEFFLEGCTRSFLINPILENLFSQHNVKHEWFCGSSFDSQYDFPNMLYEIDAYIEFIIEHNGKRIGCRYEHYSDRAVKSVRLEQDLCFLFNKKHIPGFETFTTVDETWTIDWSGLTDAELAEIHPPINNLKSLNNDISIQAFFQTILSNEVYQYFFTTCHHAIEQAQQIIALKAVPQLLSSNMLDFRMMVLNLFSESRIQSLQYEFSKAYRLPIPQSLNQQDLNIINHAFFTKKYKTSIIGSNDFAKSFITSEYLFSTISDGLAIDYTAVVVGYIKAIEQLLYLYYLSAFSEKPGLAYWDCEKKFNSYINSLPKNKRNTFTLLPQDCKSNPYFTNSDGTPVFLYKFYHRKKLGKNAPTFGELIYFLRYNEPLWNISEAGKEYIFSCLNDYCDFCRNHHFHKDNIWCADYDTVKRIRNNTHVCLYYLLGAFKLLNPNKDTQIQLGIKDYTFENLYHTVYHRRRRCLHVKLQDGYDGFIFYLEPNSLVQYDENSCLSTAEMYFLKFPDVDPSSVPISLLKKRLADTTYVKNNTFTINRDTAPLSFEPVRLLRK